MKLALLGGNSIGNVEWLEGMDVVLRKDADSIIAYRYSHWKTKAPIIDFDAELDRLETVLKNEPHYVFVAKSAGSLLVLKGTYERRLFPLACVFIGTAVLWGREKGLDVDQWIKECRVPTLYIHKLHYPDIYADDLKKLLKDYEAENYSLAVLPGDGHDYSEYQSLGSMVGDFLSKIDVLR
jgi:pimeloyl-ACP methyl ester carboxylesterase